MRNQIQTPFYNQVMDQNYYYGQYYTQPLFTEPNYFNNGDMFAQNNYNHGNYDYQQNNFANTGDNANQVMTSISTIICKDLYNLQNLSKVFFGENFSQDSKTSSDLSKNSSRNNDYKRIRKERKTSSLLKSRAQDWKCTNCHYLNFAKRKSCKKCLSNKNSSSSILKQLNSTLS